MLAGRRVIVDNGCEITSAVEKITDKIVCDFSQHTVEENTIYIIGREQLKLNVDKIRNNIDKAYFIFSSPVEGSETIKNWCEHHCRVVDLIQTGKMLLISGGDIESKIPYLLYDHFLTLFPDENRLAIERSAEIFNKYDKPYKFLFLNGRSRPHRKYLLDNVDLSQALYTNLDSRQGEIKYLPEHYEFNRFNTKLSNGFVKNTLFNNTWGDGLVKIEPYVDTYFSLVSETVFDYPYSFRTEKIWKPILVGHPWIVAANAGYYRDIRNLGFKTFSHLINESFDTIDNNQDRLKRIVMIVNDLINQNLSAFLTAAEQTCKYNQQHFLELNQQVQQEFPQQLTNYINERFGF